MKKIFFLLCFVLFFSTAVFAKSFSLPKAEVFMQINNDASIYVTEKITFRFDGSFSFAYRDIPKGVWQISNVQVLENGVPLQFSVSNHGNDTRIQWNFKAQNELRTFEITYTLANALNVYTDVSELNWKVWGEGWDARLGELYGEIVLPKKVSDPKDVYSWGHPELNGQIGLLENQRLIFQTFNIASNQWVEIHMAFPTSLLDSPIFGIQKQGEGLSKIISEEESYLFFQKNFPYFLLALSIVYVAFLVWLYLKFGKDPRVLENVYETSPPFDYNPAIANSIFSDFNHKPSARVLSYPEIRSSLGI